MYKSYYWPADRAGVLHPAGVPADRGELPVVARSVFDYLRAARGAGRNRVVPVSDPYAIERAGAYRGHHVHGRGHGQFHPGGELCPRAAWRCWWATRVKAALNAGFVRLRPVIMTALAMIIGMMPMALGLGDGGEQNAPLGRAVIGGLLVATVATLFFVPVVFLRGARLARAPAREARRQAN